MHKEAEDSYSQREKDKIDGQISAQLAAANSSEKSLPYQDRTSAGIEILMDKVYLHKVRESSQNIRDSSEWRKTSSNATANWQQNEGMENTHDQKVQVADDEHVQLKEGDQ